MNLPLRLKATVIVPVFNRPEPLRRAVRSILQNANDVLLDVLIVDDGSTDETPVVIRELTERHAEVRCVRRDNGGVTKARNTGLDHIAPDADVVTFLDSDDVMTPQRFAADLPALMAEHADGRRVELTYGRMLVTNDMDGTTLSPPAHAVTQCLVGVQLGCGLYRRSLIDRIGRFDEDLLQSEDTDYLLRIFEEETAFAQTDTICQYYVRHAGNMTKRTDEAKKYFAMTVLKSVQRRRRDPSRALNKPVFEVRLPIELL